MVRDIEHLDTSDYRSRAGHNETRSITTKRKTALGNDKVSKRKAGGEAKRERHTQIYSSVKMKKSLAHSYEIRSFQMLAKDAVSN
jgi:hypothetical protein